MKSLLSTLLALIISFNSFAQRWQENLWEYADNSSVCVISYFPGHNPRMASGFIVEKNSQFFVITNWHNISSKDPYNEDVSFGNLMASHIKVVGFSKFNKGTFSFSKDIMLDHSERNYTTIEYQNKFTDIVAISIDTSGSTLKMHPLNYKSGLKYVRKEGNKVFYVGYPGFAMFGQGSTRILPVARFSTIAKKPLLDPKAPSVDFIIAAAIRGFSGSPVFTFGKRSEPILIGIISATVDNNQTASLGVFWPIEIINALIDKIPVH